MVEVRELSYTITEDGTGAVTIEEIITVIKIVIS